MNILFEASIVIAENGTKPPNGELRHLLISLIPNYDLMKYYFFRQLVELKNGETYNGHLVSCDTWMNINLREVICTSKVSIKFNIHELFVCVCCLSIQVYY